MKADLLQNNHFTYGATRGISASGCNGRHRRHFKRKNDMKPMKTLPLLLLALAVGAQAQDDSDTGWRSSVGVTAGVTPRYLGSDKSHIAVSPDFTFTDGTFFADSERGLGAQYQNGDGFTASAALNYDLGRTEKNSIYRPGSKELKGMGRVKGSALANVSVSQEITPWLAVGGDVNVPLAGQKHRGVDSRKKPPPPAWRPGATTSDSPPIKPLHAPRLRRFFFCALPVAALTCRRFHILRS